LLARAPDQVTVVDVLGAIREPPASHDVDPGALSRGRWPRRCAAATTPFAVHSAP
jgi:hypothetical protein